jgi:hypothetical protein
LLSTKNVGARRSASWATSARSWSDSEKGVGGQHHHGSVGVEQGGVPRCGVVEVDGTDPRRVDQYDAVGQQR